MVASADELLVTALKSLPVKPPDSATREKKKEYSELMSRAISNALAEALRHRGLRGIRPSGPGDAGVSGAGRRLAGGLGAKKIDVSWSTEESGLLLGISLATINFRDGRTKNFQKNLINRRGDLLIGAVTLHRRFPYAVMAGLLVLDKDAKADGTKNRHSTFENALPRLRIFTNRQDPAGRDEQFERLYVMLVDANRFSPRADCYRADDDSRTTTKWDDVLDDLIGIIVERNSDMYECDEAGELTKMV